MRFIRINHCEKRINRRIVFLVMLCCFSSNRAHFARLQKWGVLILSTPTVFVCLLCRQGDGPWCLGAVVQIFENVNKEKCTTLFKPNKGGDNRWHQKPHCTWGIFSDEFRNGYAGSRSRNSGSIWLVQRPFALLCMMDTLEFPCTL